MTRAWKLSLGLLLTASLACGRPPTGGSGGSSATASGGTRGPSSAGTGATASSASSTATGSTTGASSASGASSTSGSAAGSTGSGSGFSSSSSGAAATSSSGGSGSTGASPAVKLYGRFDASDPAGPRYTWSGSSIAAQFTGSAVTAQLNEQTGNVYYVGLVDALTPVRFKSTAGTQSYPLASGLAAGTHSVVLLRDTEGFGGVSQFLGFDFGPGGQLLPFPAGVARYRLEFVGDSNTAGYGVLGTNPCPFSYDTESAFHAVPQVTAQMLGAPPATQVSYSGVGFFRNYGQTAPDPASPAMPSYYPRTFSDDPSSLWSFPSDPDQQPNVVVISMAGNDFWDGTGPAQADFLGGVRNLYQQVRSHDPSAYIILAPRTQLPANAYTWLQQVVTESQAAGDGRIQFTQLPFYDGVSTRGCDGHPSVDGQRNAATTLVGLIQQLPL